MEPSQPLIAVAAVALLWWAAAVAFASFRNAPNDPTADPATTDLGDESPAVANLLTDGFRVTSESLPATLLDLAARRLVDIELVAANEHVIRVKRRAPVEALTSYEQQVLDHVERVAVNGVVPAHALTTGPKEKSRWWWRHFREGVIADAQRRGLSVDRWRGRVVLMLWGLALVPSLIYGIAIRFDLDNVDIFSWAGLMFAALIGMAAVLVALTGSRAQRDTPAGLDAAGRWLGVRAELAKNEVLETVPPSAVAVWGRHLAYAAAMGLAAAAVTGLPLGAEDDRVAWSSVGGRWRRVEVRYPRFRPGWGLPPKLAVTLGLLWATPAILILAALFPYRYPEQVEPYPGIALFFGRLQVALVVVCALVALGGVAAAVQGVMDGSGTQRVVGAALRCRSRSVVKMNPWRRYEKRRYYVAVDDGTKQRIYAWSVAGTFYDQIHQHDQVEVDVTPRLGHVARLVAVFGPGTSEPRAAEPSIE